MKYAGLLCGSVYVCVCQSVSCMSLYVVYVGENQAERLSTPSTLPSTRTDYEKLTSNSIPTQGQVLHALSERLAAVHHRSQAQVQQACPQTVPF